VVVAGGSATEVISTPVEIMADVVTSTHEMTSMSAQTSGATTSLAMAGAVVLKMAVQQSFSSKIIVPSMILATSRLDLNKVLPSHLQSQVSDSSSQGSHDSHRGNSFLSQQSIDPLI
jgi:hypothetical protein